jgi:hypothetical protein
MKSGHFYVELRLRFIKMVMMDVWLIVANIALKKYKSYSFVSELVVFCTTMVSLF